MNYQYADWKAVKEELNEDEFFDIVAFPTSHFLLQEPGRNDEIMNLLQYVRPGGGFIPNYRVAAKAEVNGANEEGLYTFLKGACPGPTERLGETSTFYWTPIRQYDITWNFEKFLIDHEGKPVRRYNPVTSPLNVKDDIVELIEIAKAAKAAKAKNETKSNILKTMVDGHNKPKA